MQLIETFAEIIIFIGVLVIQRKRPQADSLRFYLVTYAILRFLDEFLQGDEIRGIWFGLSTAQWISIAIIGYYIIKIITRRS